MVTDKIPRNPGRMRWPFNLPGLSQIKIVWGTVFLLFLSYCSTGSLIYESEHEKSPVFRVGFEPNSSVYRWANGYRELMLPTFNTSREARRSVVSGGLFSIVSFDNVPCNADSGDIGTCYSNRECKNLNGESSGICAGNYGTCCVVSVTCGATVTTNNTYFTNPDYPGLTNGPLTCSITVQNLDGATQLYLEMLDFNIRGPSSGACLNDTFTVTTSTGASTSSLPILCGNNTGQMLYVPLATGPNTITFNLAGDSNGLFRQASSGRSWKIRLVQFKPGDFCFAPDGCTQYYRDPVGVFETFNFDVGMGELLDDYCINACFLVSSPNCGVLLTEGTFMMPGVAPSDCTEGSFLQCGGQRFCGDTLNNGMIMVNTTGGSSVAQVMVCSGNNNPDMDLGFSLNYSPFPCSMAG